MADKFRNYIGGEWVAPASSRRFELIGPQTPKSGEVMSQTVGRGRFDVGTNPFDRPGAGERQRLGRHGVRRVRGFGFSNEVRMPRRIFNSLRSGAERLK